MPTACARKGIYRYFEGYVSRPFGVSPATDPTVANIQSATARQSYTLSRQVTTWDGTPVANLHLPYYLGGTYVGKGIDLVDRWATPDVNHQDRLARLMAFSPFGVIKKALPYLGGTGTWDPAVDINCEQVQVVTDKNSPLYGFPSSDWVDYTGTWNTSGIARPTNNYGTTGAGSSWDLNRGPDKSGYIGQLMGLMTKPNIYSTGDSLNWAGYRWTRRNNGVDNIYGIGENPNRKQLNIRIDHTINTKNGVSASYTYESNKSDTAMKTTPTNSYGGKIVRLPSTLSAALTTTVKPNFLNELRAGFTRSNSYSYSPLGNPDTGADLKKLMYDLLPTGDWPGYQNIKNQNLPVIVSLYNFGINNTNYNPYGGGSGSMSNDWGSTDMRWSYTDTVTLTLDRHSFRIGGETQRLKSDYKTTGPANFANSSVYPIVAGGTPNGALPGVSITGFYPSANTWTLPGTVGTANTGNMGGIYNLLNLMSGSVASISQYFFINEPTATKYNQITDGEIWRRLNFRQNNFDFFIQDNWKVTDDLTLNLGMRYEWYGVPYNSNGMTGGLVGGPGAALGLSGRNLTHWLNLDYNPQISPSTDAYKNCTDKSGAKIQCDLTQYAFIGPGSPNPDMKFYNNDWNNYGPVFGFAYALPWGGEGKTVLRGGLQISYTSFGRSTSSLPDIPGVSQTYSDNNGGAYMDLSTIKNKIPISLPTSSVPPAISEKTPPPADYHGGNLTVYDPNIRTPYTEGLNLSLTRSLRSNVTLELRYSGSLSHKQTSQIDLNSVNFLGTGLMKAFQQARAGGNPELLNRVLKGVNIAGATSTNTAFTWGRIGVDIDPRTGQVYQAGDELRASGSSVQCGLYGDFVPPGSCLAGGYFNQLAQWMATANLNTAWNPGVPYANSSVSKGQMLRVAGMPDNYITANPQFGSVYWTGNFNNANYHSGQAQVTLRPAYGLGLSFQFTWSKSMGMGAPADFSNRDLEYRVLSAGKSIQSYGTFDLPFGPNRRLFSNVSPNILGRVIGGWQLNWILTMSTGDLLNVTSTLPYLWNGSNPVQIMGPFDNKSGQVTWIPGAAQGNYFGGKYSYALDPQCRDRSITEYRGIGGLPVTPEHPNLQSSCNLYATTLLSTGQIIFANPVAGIRGNYGLNQITGPRTWNADGAMSKTFKLTEGKSLQLRVDASNVFNHATLGSPDLNVGIGYTNLGGISSKSGNRKFQARIRLDF
jgi:hypothetical protein